MALLAVVISLSWMSLVTIWPAASRPYIDGSTDNSAFQQVFVATFLQSPTTNDPRLTWIARHCMNVTQRAASQRMVLPLAVYVCLASTT
jgi:hypothetical protein